MKKRIEDKRLYLEIGILYVLLIVSIVLTAIVGFDAAVGTWKYAWYIIYAPLILLSVLEIRWINRILSTKCVRVIFGRISKYIFFWHVPFLAWGGGNTVKVIPKLCEHHVQGIFDSFISILCGI